MKKIKKIIVALLVMSMTLSLFGCSSKEAQKEAKKNATPTPKATAAAKGTTGGEISVCLGGEPETIDPSTNTTVDGGTYIDHIFEGLTKVGQKGDFVVGQAKSYDVSKDGKEYTFHLRDDIKWSDGKPVKASDFVYSWRRLVDPKTASQYNYIIDIVKNANEIMAGKAKPETLGIEAPDDKTVKITLIAPCTYFLEICSFPTCCPLREDIIKQYGTKWTQKPDTYIGNGAYKMKSWDHQANIAVVKNDQYYDYSNLGPDTINFKLIEEPATQLNAFKNGELDLADTLPPEEVESMKDKGLVIEPQMGTYFYCFNTAKKEMKDVKVRKALSLAIDRDEIVSVAQNNAIPADTFVAEAVKDSDDKEFHDNAEKWYDLTKYDDCVKQAKDLLKEAGYPNGKGFPTVEILINPGHEQIAESIQNMWQTKLNIKVNIKSVDWNVLSKSRADGDFVVARHGWIADYNDPITFLDMWVTNGGNNDANYSNAKYDKLIKEAKSTTDVTERFKKLHEAEKILGEEAPIAPLYYYTDLYLITDKLQGMYTTPLGYKFFKYCKTVK